MIEEFEQKIRLEFGVLLKEGKEKVWDYIESAEELLRDLDSLNEYDTLASDILKAVRSEKRFDFQQFKEVRRFVKEHQRLNHIKPVEDNDFIIL